MSGKLGLIAAVLSSRKYAGIAAGGAVGIGLAYYFLTMSMLGLHFGAALEAAPAHLAASLGLTAAVSALAGVNFALIAYRISAARSGSAAQKRPATAVLGGAAAAFTPGCPACTAPLAVLLGAVGGLSLFPMQGLELKIVSAGVLLFSVFWVARGIERGSRSCCAAPAPSAGPAAAAGDAAAAGKSGIHERGGGGCGCGMAPGPASAAAARPDAAHAGASAGGAGKPRARGVAPEAGGP